jgi:hypothetical protein
MKSLLPLFLGVLSFFSAAKAQGVLWKPCTVSQLKEASDLVVLARVVHITPGVPGPDCVDRATLAIRQTLQGAAGSSLVQLSFPGRQRGSFTSLGNLKKENNPAHIRFDLDQEGIFFLRKRPDGSYSANHPARFKPAFFLRQILRKLAPNFPGG